MNNEHAHDQIDQSQDDGLLQDVRVLIVDDERDVLDSITVAFESEGALTLTAMDGDEAVRICEEDPPEIVILDMMLPKRSGFLALEKIKGKEDSPIVIMVTANEGKRHQAYGESLGVDAYMLKPVPLMMLVNKAADLLDAKDEADGLLDGGLDGGSDEGFDEGDEA